MKISLNWLADFVKWDDEPAKLAVRLTAAGLNVENIEEYEQCYPGVVVARVVHREKHPDADRLSVCRVDDGGEEPVQVVCGAPNVRVGLAVLFARVGSVLPGNFRIKKSKIRGVESHGMICSATELGLGGDGAGIMELDTELMSGASADELYGYRDTVLEIEVTPNRPDWLSHLGVAREVGAIYEAKVSQPACWNAQQSGESLGTKVRIDDYTDCPRYTAWGVQGLVPGPSPLWMQNRLRAVGSRPISNVVDITNYVMFELGQPMHAFDRAKLAGGTINVRRADAKTAITTLDGQEREIEPGTLLICDETEPVALAGVMGLANSGVTAETTELLLESAFFSPSLIRKTSRKLGLLSESSYRFERGADWDMVEKAALRALYLLQEHAGSRVVPDWADRTDPDRRPQAPLPLRVWQVNRLLGAEISTDATAQILQRLGLKVQPMGNPGASSANAVNMMVEVPSFRRDLELEVDLIEEIARIHGLDDLSGRGNFRAAGGGARRPRDVAVERIRKWLAANGYNEIVTSSFMDGRDHDRLGLAEDDPHRKTLCIINPHHGGDTRLRTVMLPSLLEVARRNLNAGATVPLRLFQINRVFRPSETHGRQGAHADEALLPAEPTYLQFAVAGSRAGGLDGVPADLLELKGVLAGLSEHLRVAIEPVPEETPGWHQPGAVWRLQDAEGEEVGTAGRIDSDVLAAFEVDAPVAVAEIRFDRLNLAPEAVTFVPFARFPAVKRDLSLVVPPGVRFGAICEAARDAGGALLESVELFDIYRGKGVAEGHGAFGIRLLFRSRKGNLKGKTVDGAIDAILAALKDRWQIEPRGK